MSYKSEISYVGLVGLAKASTGERARVALSCNSVDTCSSPPAEDRSRLKWSLLTEKEFLFSHQEALPSRHTWISLLGKTVTFEFISFYSFIFH